MTIFNVMIDVSSLDLQLFRVVVNAGICTRQQAFTYYLAVPIAIFATAPFLWPNRKYEMAQVESFFPPIPPLTDSPPLFPSTLALARSFRYLVQSPQSSSSPSSSTLSAQVDGGQDSDEVILDSPRSGEEESPRKLLPTTRKQRLRCAFQ